MNMSGQAWLLLVLTASVGVSGCSSWLARKAPDETQVVDGPRLIVPPNYDLRPPLNGQDAEAVLKARDETARNLITGQRGAPVGQTAIPLTAPAQETSAGGDNWLLQNGKEADKASAASAPRPVVQKPWWRRWF